MLESNELKLVLDTLGKRRAWLQKTIEDPKLAEDVKRPHIEMLKVMDSALQKLARLTPKAPSVSVSSQLKRTQITASNARILVAEDNSEACELVVGILTDAGFRLLDTAEDGIAAFDKIKSAAEPYDVILCDWDMPELSGIDIHSKAKASNTLRGAHFVMVTANSEASSIRKAIQQGINDYIVKPINAEVLVNKINVALNIETAPAQAQG
ncbi:response regulator [Saccharophagus degradans]|uniref:Response regulator receiver n=1 Tax=Saccharophagus degradans (strain 2-40 / ATCC 43961 / DSM 17024) TaxID=203122 RepID=Q21L58_SACD2|nr:response regulator [Saccharophagus degradans]ABD80571.1 response regulator receiver [Saccharophagus degradans 2-40]